MSCGRPRRPDELFTWRGKCEDCSIAGYAAVLMSMVNKEGPYWERWVEGRKRAGLAVRSPQPGEGPAEEVTDHAHPDA